ncbi:MAG: acyl-[acyl-carrier-protein]--UDP-N-acetylglucosamine O-acyltransferase [Candidatus Hydrogenedentota bacterium]|nr:MAG: acyl-[acyl-carrier-protein]--UDP-N-acetylglucosamine O-acyltransferase [Candidatus Hydrogenedentota bacterium]
MSIHATAIVHPDAKLADDVEVGPYSIIGPKVTIGAGTVIGPHCVIEGDTVIGEDNRFFSGAQIGVTSQDLKHGEELVGRTVIGNGNQFREHSSMSASTMIGEDDDHRVTSVGDNCLFMASTHIAHDCHLGNNVIMANCVCLSGHVDVEDFVTMGGLSGVHQESVVGKLAFIGGMTRASKDSPPFMIVEGNPARCVGPNTIGLQRRGYTKVQRGRIKLMYKLMYRSNLNTTQALHEIEKQVEDSEERNHFLDFVRKSVRGIIK